MVRFRLGPSLVPTAAHPFFAIFSDPTRSFPPLTIAVSWGSNLPDAKMLRGTDPGNIVDRLTLTYNDFFCWFADFDQNHHFIHRQMAKHSKPEALYTESAYRER